jgi:predicted ATP-binding protein involved in virulence
MLKKLIVEGLVGYQGDRIDINFHPDINLLTGRNGSGKTTLLKLAWYLSSGNIERAIEETPFARATLETDRYQLIVDTKRKEYPTIQLKIDNEEFDFDDENQYFNEDDEDFAISDGSLEKANELTMAIGNSLFFPTFRRIEGGFSIRKQIRMRAGFSGLAMRASKVSPIEDAMEGLSRVLSNANHSFICSISTDDIVSLLMKKYAEYSQSANKRQHELSIEIIQQIMSYKLSVGNDDPNYSDITLMPETAEEVLDSIKQRVETNNTEIDKLWSPLKAVEQVIQQLFNQKSIKLSSNITFGDAASAVGSDSLSAGEKQMLSFICYNAFNLRSSIFIDEPELSLHPDWQRQLFTTLYSQGTSNQFIVATHSPFIYSKFSDKEISIHGDRGEMIEG